MRWAHPWNELLSQAPGVSPGGPRRPGTATIWNGLSSLLPGGRRMDCMTPAGPLLPWASPITSSGFQQTCFLWGKMNPGIQLPWGVCKWFHFPVWGIWAPWEKMPSALSEGSISTTRYLFRFFLAAPAPGGCRTSWEANSNPLPGPRNPPRL